MAVEQAEIGGDSREQIKVKTQVNARVRQVETYQDAR